MAIDITQFRQVFFEESLEGLDTMESSLLHLDEDASDSEVINTIFRAAHSIKGGSATFGFQELTSFTHVMENLLDEMRAGRRQVTPPAVALLLQAVDCLRGMMLALQDNSAVDQPRVDDLYAQLEALWHAAPDESAPAPAPTVPEAPEASPQGHPRGWHITFQPHLAMLRSGNDPVRMFRELTDMGTLTTRVDMRQLPPLTELDPENCYLAWELTLESVVDERQVRDVFAWVEDECGLTLTPLHAAPVPDTVPVTATPTPAATPPAPTAQAEAAQAAAPERRVNGERRQQAAGADTSSIRVSIDKIDALINTVGELVITQAMLGQLRDGFDVRDLDKLRDGLDQLERNTRELQESVMRIRMLPMSFAFNRFPRLVHDLSQQLGKKAQLTISGEQTELDKTVMEKIGDPLVHLVRNALDHGIEPPAVRLAANKPEAGQIHLHAYHQGGAIVIEVSEDGAGLHTAKIRQKGIERGLISADAELTESEIHDLIFQAGFSTADVISEISGRGVGMDVVRRNIKDLGGTIEVTSSQGHGTTFTIRLPLTLAILEGQLVRVGQDTYIVPLVSISESLQIDPPAMHVVAGQTPLYKLREDYIPIVRLCDLFHLPHDAATSVDSLLVVVEGDGHKLGVVVDELLGQQQVVIKSLETNFKRIEGVSGATILGDGTVALILDISGLMHLAQQHTGLVRRPRRLAPVQQAA
ncbi:MAG: chemotaxis protein CheA [Candidatus Tectomicrobia bacterium]|uniref:Chemotaxis protein CheA n=1 Tax=Tectimicrobiota bacterium TaxID=2528274 RepID=A0A937W5R9_UNCTE|nr:chemotaxis protein CheA [Candidatus Tectomicrobia bacterium]